MYDCIRLGFVSYSSADHFFPTLCRPQACLPPCTSWGRSWWPLPACVHLLDPLRGVPRRRPRRRTSQRRRHRTGLKLCNVGMKSRGCAYNCRITHFRWSELLSTAASASEILQHCVKQYQITRQSSPGKLVRSCAALSLSPPAGHMLIRRFPLNLPTKNI